VEFHRNRDLYMRKHHTRAEAAVVRVLTAWAYLVRALWRRDRRRQLLHARQALMPSRGQGMREAAENYNRMHGTPSGNAKARP
jgi:N-acetylglucosaminyl-diphospho-decaprenol L-rhamnosyltransferase